MNNQEYEDRLTKIFGKATSFVKDEGDPSGSFSLVLTNPDASMAVSKVLNRIAGKYVATPICDDDDGFQYIKEFQNANIVFFDEKWAKESLPLLESHSQELTTAAQTERDHEAYKLHLSTIQGYADRLTKVFDKTVFPPKGRVERPGKSFSLVLNNPEACRAVSDAINRIVGKTIATVGCDNKNSRKRGTTLQTANSVFIYEDAAKEFLPLLETHAQELAVAAQTKRDPEMDRQRLFAVEDILRRSGRGPERN